MIIDADPNDFVRVLLARAQDAVLASRILINRGAQIEDSNTARLVGDTIRSSLAKIDALNRRDQAF